jgi:hypothetical protein
VGGDPFDAQAALQSSAQAEELHPRNREATSALRRLAKAVRTDHPEEARDFASLMAETSPYLANYGPVRKQLSGQ